MKMSRGGRGKKMGAALPSQFKSYIGIGVRAPKRKSTHSISHKTRPRPQKV